MLDRLAKLWRDPFITSACMFLMAFALTGCKLTERLTKKNEVPNANVPQPVNGPELDKNGSAAREQPTRQPVVTAASVAGTYRYKSYRPGEGGYDNTLKVEAKRGGKLGISLAGCYTHRVSGEETMDADLSEVGEATLHGNRSTARVFTGQGSECRVMITFDGDNAEVKAEQACKFNVVLDGTYIKENGGEQAAAGSEVIVTSDPAAVVDTIYRDFFAHGQVEEGTFKRHRAQFSPELRALWEADRRESVALEGEGVTGLDVDPFTDMQDYVQGCSIGTATREGNDALVPVTVGPVKIQVRLTQSNDTWLITNFDYGGGDNLVKTLKELAKERRKNYPDRYKK